MKKFLLLVATISVTSALNAQIYSAPDSTAFADWTPYDMDGDGNDWEAAVINNPSITAPGFDGSSGMISASWATNPLTPDNVIVSPAIDCSAAPNVSLSWSAGNPETTMSGWYEEHYAVYILTPADIPGIMTGTYPTSVFETTLSAGEVFFNESVDVSAEAGGQATVYIAFRHYNCTDENWIFVKDLVMAASNSLTESSIEANAYPNPANSELTVSVKGNATSVSIISMDGKVVSTQDFVGAATTINVSELIAGVYFYEVTAEDGSVVRNTFVKK